jgi:hypothetical protein
VVVHQASHHLRFELIIFAGNNTCAEKKEVKRKFILFLIFVVYISEVESGEKYDTANINVMKSFI